MSRRFSWKNNKNFFKQHGWKIITGVLLIALVYQQMYRDDYYPVYSTNSAREDYAMESFPMSAPSMKLAIDSGGGYDEGESIVASQNTEDRKIIKTANMTVQVDDGEESYMKLKEDLKAYDAFIDSASVYESYSDGYPKEASLNVRVNVEQFENLMTLIRSYGYVKSESVSGQDVTKEYSDLEAEITNLKLREEKVREFYNKAIDVEDTLNIYRELSSIQAEIDRLNRNLQSLDNQTTYSTIYVNFTPLIQITDFQNPDWTIKVVWREAVNNLILTLHWIAEKGLAIIVYATIWLPLLLITLILRRRYWKK